MTDCLSFEARCLDLNELEPETHDNLSPHLDSMDFSADNLPCLDPTPRRYAPSKAVNSIMNGGKKESVICNLTFASGSRV